MTAASYSVESGAAPVPRRLRFHERLAYGAGHFYNDLCSSNWFSYLLIYLHYVLQFSNTLAGVLLLWGQIVDAICTPLVGYESDRTSACFCRYGKRKSWHLFGTILVTCSFPFIFSPCIGCGQSDDWAQLIYYVPFYAISQIGWASVQIAHLALLSEIASSDSDRVGLTAYRNAATLLSSVVVYGLAWGLLGTSSDKQWTADDAPQFLIQMMSLIGIGLLASTYFHLVTPEPRFMPVEPKKATEISIADASAATPKTNKDGGPTIWSDWLKEWQFYAVTMAYMFARLIVNVSQTYWPLYLIETLQVAKIYIAIIPLVVFVVGFFVSLVMRPVNRLLGRKLTFFIALCVTGASSVWMLMLDPSTSMQVFGVAVLLGAGSAALSVTSLSMVADVIGGNTGTAGFVYGAVGVADKLSSGTALLIVQYLNPCDAFGDVTCSGFYKNIMVFLPMAFAAAGFIMLIILIPMKLGSLRRKATTGGSSIEGDDEETDEEKVTASECPPLTRLRRMVQKMRHRSTKSTGQGIPNGVTSPEIGSKQGAPERSNPGTHLDLASGGTSCPHNNLALAGEDALNCGAIEHSAVENYAVTDIHLGGLDTTKLENLQGEALDGVENSTEQGLQGLDGALDGVEDSTEQGLRRLDGALDAVENSTEQGLQGLNGELDAVEDSTEQGLDGALNGAEESPDTRNGKDLCPEHLLNTGGANRLNSTE